MAATAQQRQARKTDRLNVARFALAKFAGSRSARDLLADGATHRVDLEVTGTVDRGKVAEQITGTLTVGHPTEQADDKVPDRVDLVAHLFAAIDPARREKILAEWPAYFRDHGELPDFGDDRRPRILAELLLHELRQAGTKTRRGSVSFRPS